MYHFWRNICEIYLGMSMSWFFFKVLKTNLDAYRPLESKWKFRADLTRRRDFDQLRATFYFRRMDVWKEKQKKTIHQWLDDDVAPWGCRHSMRRRRGRRRRRGGWGAATPASSSSSSSVAVAGATPAASAAATFSPSLVASSTPTSWPLGVSILRALIGRRCGRFLRSATFSFRTRRPVSLLPSFTGFFSSTSRRPFSFRRHSFFFQPSCDWLGRRNRLPASELIGDSAEFQLDPKVDKKQTKRTQIAIPNSALSRRRRVEKKGGGVWGKGGGAFLICWLVVDEAGGSSVDVPTSKWAPVVGASRWPAAVHAVSAAVGLATLAGVSGRRHVAAAQQSRAAGVALDAGVAARPQQRRPGPHRRRPRRRFDDLLGRRSPTSAGKQPQVLEHIISTIVPFVSDSLRSSLGPLSIAGLIGFYQVLPRLHGFYQVWPSYTGFL